MVWGGGALSLGVRAVPKGPIDRANKVSSSSLPPSRYSSTPRFERHPPLPHPTSPLPRCLATAAPPARSQMAGRAAGAPRAGTGCANLPPPIAIAFPARGGRPVGRGGGSAARVSSGLPPPPPGPAPPRAQPPSAARASDRRTLAAGSRGRPPKARRVDISVARATPCPRQQSTGDPERQPAPRLLLQPPAVSLAVFPDVLALLAGAGGGIPTRRTWVSARGRRWAVESVAGWERATSRGEGGGATAAAETTKRLAVSQQAVGRCRNKRGSGAS